MNFLNKDRSQNKWLPIVLGVFYALTSAFVNMNSSEMVMRSMGLMFDMEVSTGYYFLVLLTSTGISVLFFILFVGMAYSMAYRSLASKTRDLKVMPISKECFINHIEFIMIFANLIIGAINLVLRFNILYMMVVDIIVRFVVRVLAYLLALWLLTKVGIGDNVNKKIYGGFLTPLAVLVVILM